MKYLSLLLFFLSPPSHAIELPCAAEIQHYLEQSTPIGKELGNAQLSGPGEKQVLAYPTRRTGTWIEKHFLSSGETKIFEVDGKSRTSISANVTDHCHLIRSIQPNPEAPFWLSNSRGDVSDFDDPALSKLIEQNSAGLIYIWSPKMPLSVTGISTFQKVAKQMGLPLTVLVDPSLSDEDYQIAHQRSGLGADQVQTRAQSFELFYRGALLHFPSVVVYQAGKIVGTPILGNREDEGWLAAIQNWLKPAPEFTESFNLPTANHSIQVSQIAGTKKIQIRKITVLPKRFGYFDKPIWGTRWMGIHIDWSNSYYFNLDTGALVDLGYTNDTYVTPFDHLYTTYWATPGSSIGGEIGIMETSEFFKIAATPAYRPAPLFLDSTLNADYQSVGHLREDFGSSTYRVITGGYRNFLTYRDYQITHRKGIIAPKINPVKPTGYLCKRTLGQSQFATPILSKDGQEIGVTVASGTTEISKVFRLDPRNPEICTEEISFTLQTSKISFSFDHKTIAFGYQNTLYLYRRDLNKLFKVTGFEERLGRGSALFPEFRRDGSLVMPYLEANGKMDMVEFSVN